MDITAEQIFGDHLEPQGPIEIDFLGQYSDVMRDDLRDVVGALLGEDAARFFTSKVGAGLDNSGEVSFIEDGQLSCNEVSALEGMLLRRGRLNEGLSRKRNRLRAQYAGLYYYYLKQLIHFHLNCYFDYHLY